MQSQLIEQSAASEAAESCQDYADWDARKSRTERRAFKPQRENAGLKKVAVAAVSTELIVIPLSPSAEVQTALRHKPTQHRSIALRS